MDSRTFWRTTPRKFFALLEAHNRANTVEEDDEVKVEKFKKGKVEPATLEDMKAWAKR